MKEKKIEEPTYKKYVEETDGREKHKLAYKNILCNLKKIYNWMKG